MSVLRVERRCKSRLLLCMGLLKTKIEIMSISKSKKAKIAVFVVMALMIVGMVFLVKRDKIINETNDAGYHVADTTVFVPAPSE